MRTACLVLLLAAVAGCTYGQSIWPRPYEPNQVAVEWVAPTFENDAISALTSATFVTATTSLSSNVELVAELPVAYYSADSTGASLSTSALGNPYLGVGLSSTSRPFLLELGVRLPLAPDNAATTAGAFTDPGRSDAFRHDERSVSALLNWRFPLGRRTSFRLRSGPSLAAFPDGTGGTDREFRLHYSGQLWRDGDRLIVGLTGTGRLNLSRSGSFPTKAQHHLAASVMANFDRVQPGVLLGYALDPDTQDAASFLVGVTVSVSYGD